MASTPISKVTPDFQLLFDALQRKLEKKRTWVDILPTSVGTTVMDMFAGAGVSNQFYLDMAFREAFLPTAVRDSSIFAGTRMMGVQISRKTCASCTVEVSNYSTRTRFLPPYSMFDLSGRTFFTREQYVVPPGQTVSNIQVYSGTVKEKSFDLTGIGDLALREFYLEEPGFVVSAEDVLVYTTDKDTGNVQVWDPTDRAIFEHGGADPVYFESTSRDGDTSFFFGDGQYGQLLDVGSVMTIRYVVTDGSGGNTGLPGIQVRVLNDSELKGESITSIAGGADEKSALYYKMFAPNMFRTKRRAISSADIRATIMSYPGVADCAALGQRDIAPSDARWMNTVRICVLPEERDKMGGANPNPKSSQWAQFREWLMPFLHDAYDVQTWNPTKVFVKVRVKVAILPSAKDGEIRIVAMENVLKLFQKKPGILGRRLSQSDITEAIRKIEGVDYVEIESPAEDILMPDRTHYAVLDGQPVIDVVYSERALGVRGAY
tara:strand:+ start:36688 stop:38157 length:1470 start_codon:yes stop_codon:yes gene_type:complete